MCGVAARPAALFGRLGRVLARSGHALAGPARPPQPAHRLGSARTHHTADDLDRDLAAVPAGDRLEGEQLAVVQPGPRPARRIDRTELELPVPDADALGFASRHRSRPRTSAGRPVAG